MKLHGLILVCLLWSATTLADVYYGFERGRILGSEETSYYSTKQNFDINGNAFSLFGNSQFNEIRERVSVEYDFTNHFGAYFLGDFKRADATIALINSQSIERTTLDPGDIGAGIQYSYYTPFVTLIPEFFFSVPSYGVPGSDLTAALIGDGASVFTVKMNLAKKIDSFFTTATIGYSYLTNGYSSNVPFSVAARGFFSSWFAEAGAYGYLSLKNDQYSNSPFTRFNILNNQDGGSFVYGSVNPSIVNLRGTVGYNFSRRLLFDAGVDYTVWGQDTAQGFRIFGGLIFQLSALAPGNGSLATSSSTNNNGEFEVDTKNEDIPLRKK